MELSAVRQVYATRVRISPQAHASQEDPLSLIRQVWSSWVAKLLQRRAAQFRRDTGAEHTPDFCTSATGTQVPLDGIRVEQDWWVDPGNSSRFSGTFLIREFQGSSRFWVTEFRAASNGNDTFASVRMGIEFTEFRVAPTRWTLRSPGIWNELTNRFNCTINGHSRMFGAVESYSQGDVQALTNELGDNHRLLPIVVVSASNATQQPPVDPILPQALSRELFGLAAVHYLRDAETSWAFSDAIGSEHSCYNGAMRIYWPGFDSGRSPDFRTLLLPDQIVYRSHPGSAAVGVVVSAVLRRICAVGIARFTLPAVFSEMEEAKQFARRAIDASNLREELSRMVDETAIATIEEAIKKKDDERDEMQRGYEIRITAMQDQISEISRQFDSRNAQYADCDDDEFSNEPLAVEYFATSRKSRPVLDFADDEFRRDAEARHEYFKALSLMPERWSRLSEGGDGTRIEKLAGSQISLRSGQNFDIWEYRAIQRQGGWVRVLFAIADGNTAVLLHAVTKRQNRLGADVIATAQKRAKQYFGDR